MNRPFIKEIGDEMNRNIQQLLEILLQQENYLTAAQLAEIIGVTERSIRNYVRTLNRGETDNPLIISSSLGYRIQKNLYDESIKNKLSSDQDDSNLLFRIANILINQKSYLSFDELSAKLNYSVESIRMKVQMLFLKINDLHINVTLDSQIFTGIRLLGDENQKRLLLELLIPLESVSRSKTAETIRIAINNLATTEEIESQIVLLDRILSSNHITMDFVVYIKIVCHLLIQQFRYRNGFKISDDEITGIDRNYAERLLAEQILKGLVPSIQSPGEVTALTNYLIALPINIPTSSIPETNKRQMEMIEDALKEAEVNYSIPLFSNEHYRAQITKHILRLLNPLSENIPIFNPYSKETKREYLFAYSISCFLYEKLEHSLSLRIPESEIAFLAIHVQLILTEETKNPVNTTLVFNGKSAEAELFKYKLQTFFPTIQIRRISSSLTSEIISSSQLVINCGVYESQPYHNVINVTRELTEDDVQQLQHFVDSMGVDDLIKNLDYYHIEVNSSEEAIRTLINRSGYDNLLPYFLKREALSPTDIGNFVALPHPFLKGSESAAKIIVGINKTDIKWGHQNVRLIIIYIPTADLKTNKNFFNEVYQRSNDLNRVYQLINTQEKSEFIQIWNQKGEITHAL